MISRGKKTAPVALICRNSMTKCVIARSSGFWISFQASGSEAPFVCGRAVKFFGCTADSKREEARGDLVKPQKGRGPSRSAESELASGRSAALFAISKCPPRPRLKAAPILKPVSLSPRQAAPFLASSAGERARPPSSRKVCRESEGRECQFVTLYLKTNSLT